ncbi:MAG TPA: hypothetical protein VLA87_02245 [Gaiellaceae bacterium]|nr:hypothetical protein [Gaiellaceae bacterium]
MMETKETSSQVRTARRASPSTVSLPQIEGAAPSRGKAAVSTVEIQQYRGRAILAIWAAAALPMGVLAWIIAPPLADNLSGAGNVPMAKALLVLLTAGLIWQFVLVAALVWREQRTFRWSTLREALWLRSPQSPRSGRTGGRVRLVLIPLMVAYAAVPFIFLQIGHPDDRDFGTFLESDSGQSFMSGNWGWFGLMLVLWVLTPCSARSSSSAAFCYRG